MKTRLFPFTRRTSVFNQLMEKLPALTILKPVFVTLSITLVVMTCVTLQWQPAAPNISLVAVVDASKTLKTTTLPPPQTATAHQDHLRDPFAEERARMAWKRLWCRKKKFELFAYTAHYDDREYRHGVGPAVVRVMTAAQVAENKGVTVMCLVYYDNSSEPEVTPALRDDLSVGLYIVGHIYQEFLYTCLLRSAAVIPTRVSLVCSYDQRPQFSLPVEVPARPAVRGQFAVCVCATYDHRNPYQLIEWMELQKMLGAEKVTVYNHTMDDDTARTLLHFAKEGFVEFRQSPPFFRVRGKVGAKLHQTPTINDCIYRNMYKYWKILVLDFDEMIVPLQHENLSDLISAIDRKHHYAHEAKSYMFRNEYFFFELPEELSESEKLVTQRHRMRLPVSEKGVSVKSVMDPQACVTMHNHYCWKRTLHHDSAGHTIQVHKSLGLNYHYKNCHFSMSKCRQMMTEYSPDYTMIRFKKQLIRRVQPHYEALGLPGL